MPSLPTIVGNYLFETVFSFLFYFYLINRWIGGSGVPPGGQKFSGLVAGSER
jgi:hypothetical protein